MILKSASALALVLALAPMAASAQVAGGESIGDIQVSIVANGLSLKRQVLGQNVMNDKNDKIGSIDDVIVTPENSISFVVIGAGGFLGVDRHDVLVPVTQLKISGGKFVLPGATKDTIKSIPPFKYSKEAK